MEEIQYKVKATVTKINQVEYAKLSMLLTDFCRKHKAELEFEWQILNEVTVERSEIEP